jgi:glycosyltransferase involved in cell wall biosynthesis
MLKNAKILQILPELGSGGVERGTIEVATALQAAGAEPIVTSAGGKMVAQLEGQRIAHHHLPLASKNPLTIWQNISHVEALIKRENISLVHARSRAPAWSAYYAAKRCKVPFLTTFHGVYNGYHYVGPKRAYNAIMTKGKKIIAVSEHVAKHIQRYYGIPERRIRTIHRGADVNYFDPAKKNPIQMSDLCDQWRVKENVPILLLPGRLTRWKGQHVLLEALGQLPHRNFFCVLLGEPGKHPGYVRELESLVSQHQLEGCVRMVGTTQDMRNAYAVADVILSPAIEPEAFGRVPVEAQAMGKSIIATAHGGAMETIRTDDDYTGWLVPPGDAESLSKAIERVLQLPDSSLEALKSRTREHIIRHFSTQKMCEGVLSVYEELLG